MTNAFYYFWAAIAGLCLGSFLNVVALRDQKRGSIVKGRSECPHCKHMLAWYDLFPVLSYVTLAGRCRYCKKPISWRYPLVEVLSSALTVFVLWYAVIQQGSWWLFVGLLISLCLLLVVSMIDLASLEVPLEYVVIAGVIGGGSMLLAHQLSLNDLLWGLLAGAGSIAFVLYGWKLLFKQDGMGVGDIWLAGAIGAIVGYPLIITALVGAVFSGAIIGVLLLGLQKKGLASPLPFGPFLLLGLIIALIWGQSIIKWYIL